MKKRGAQKKNSSIWESRALLAGLVGLAGGLAISIAAYTSSPGDLTYGLKEALVEIRTALTPDDKRKQRYVEASVRQAGDLEEAARRGATDEEIARAAERLGETNRNAQTSGGTVTPGQAALIQQQQQTLQSVLNQVDGNARKSVRRVLNGVRLPKVGGSSIGL